MKHLAGLLHLLKQQERSSLTDLSSFCVEYFLFHFVLARTVFCIKDLESVLINTSACQEAGDDLLYSTDGLQTTYPESSFQVQGLDSKSSLNRALQVTGVLSSWMIKSALDAVNTYSGLSNSLLLLINRITDLKTPSSKTDLAELGREVSILRTALESLDQRVPRDLDPITSSQVSISAEVYRLASLLFLHQKISLICGRVPFRTNALRPQFSDSEIYDLVCHVLEHLEKNPNLTKTASIPLWPLFIVGCSVDDEFLRTRVLKIFHRTETLKRFGVSTWT